MKKEGSGKCQAIETLKHGVAILISYQRMSLTNNREEFQISYNL